MVSSFIRPADRVASLQPYFFDELNKKIAVMRSQGRDVIRLDMGSPDMPPEPFITDRLAEAARRPDAHGYSPYGGVASFRKAVAGYYQTRFGVTLDPQKEVLGLIGSKEGLFTLSQVLLNPGDLALVPDPGYPVYSSSAAIAGAGVYLLPLLAKNHYLPDLDAIPQEVLERARVLWLNYPNNPTGAIAPLSFFEKAVEFARSKHLVIAHDAPYCDVCFDGFHAPSILQVPGAKDVAIEFNSLSKTYNMAGWRVGMAVGNAEVVGYINAYKSLVDSAHFQPVYEAAIAAMQGDQSWTERRNQVYQERRDVILAGLRRAGFEVETPLASLYVWARLPAHLSDDMAFCTNLLEQTGISMTPGIVYGPNGAGFIRISLVIPLGRIQEASARLVEWVAQTQPIP